MVRKNYFCVGPIRAVKPEKKFLISAIQAQRNQPRKDTFHLYTLSPHSPQFQQSAGATPLSGLSGPAEQTHCMCLNPAVEPTPIQTCTQLPQTPLAGNSVHGDITAL
jgi:hypothetical protein